ncbi:hypothetical protein LOD99_8734 [Oopsacas minuta]|uniref:Gustatory receptor n=1 Tax=Oopsacas minuta TaxID=111878 RepID=A0AAV7JFL1_9METZ|nr:hypothetical protein LOD99_8734 [Oopsacas minuta]
MGNSHVKFPSENSQELLAQNFDNLSNNDVIINDVGNDDRIIDEEVVGNEDLSNAGRRIEGAKIFWFVPVLDLASCRMYPYISGCVTFNEGSYKSIRSIVLIMILCSCVLLQFLMFSAFLADLIFRPLLFIKIHTGMYPNQTHAGEYPNQTDNSLTSLVFTTNSQRYYHEYEDWFLFIWDYLYGLIGLYSTVFIFIHSWNNEAEFQGIVTLIKKIRQNKMEIRKEKSQLINVTKDEEGRGRRKRMDTERLHMCITCSDNRMQSFIDNIGWGLFHLCIIILSISLVVYWIVVNAIGCYANTNSTNLLTQDSDLALLLSIIDSIHWHLSPVIVCFIIRISCMEITTSLDCLCYAYASGLIREGRNEVKNLQRKYYQLISKVNAICMKYRRISAINITVLVFAAVGICLRYIDSDKIVSIDEFIMYDWLDFIRFSTWYLVHFLSVWLMVDAMSTLNKTLDNFSNEILLILAINKKQVNINEDIKKQLELCEMNNHRLSMDLFGIVTPSTVHLIIGFGSTTILIFVNEVTKVILEKIRIN